MQLTTRDLDVMRWINAFGIVNIHHIARRYSIRLKTAYAFIQRLHQQGYIARQTLFHRQPAIYHLTLSGQQVCGSELSPLRSVSVATCRHDLGVVSVAQYLQAQQGGHFITERQLRHQMGSTGVGRTGHVSDGEFIIGDQSYAIEVELTTKAHDRLQRIYHHYLTQCHYQAVWYFCGSEVIQRRLAKIDASQQLFKFYLLADVLPQAQPEKNTCRSSNLQSLR